MRATSPSAFLLSLTLHGVIAAVLVLFGMYFARTNEIRPPVIFDLVAGPPTAPDQLEAPAIGNQFEVPKTQPKSEPTPQPEPVVETAPVTPPKTIPTPPKTPPKMQPKKTEAKKPPPKPVEKPAKKMSFDEFKKKFGKPEVKKSASTAPRPIKTPRIDAEGIAKGVRGGSTANKIGGGGGKALSREEADEMKVFEALVRNKLRAAHDEVKPSGLGELVSAEVEFFMAANGEISRVRVVRSSGIPEFDQSVLAAFRRMTWPGPRPDKQSDTWRLTFEMTEDDR